MSEQPNDSQNTPERKGFAVFILKRVVFAVLIIAAVLWALFLGIEQLGKWQAWKGQDTEKKPAALAVKPAEPLPALAVAPPAAPPMAPERTGTTAEHAAASQEPATAMIEPPAAVAPSHVEAVAPQATPAPVRVVTATPQPTAPPPAALAPPPSARAPVTRAHAPEPLQPQDKLPLGVAFVDAVIAPLDYELNQRFWGWRPNDIVNVTDNVNQFQLGVLEVSRRTVVQLAEKISRTGYNDAFDRNLENAMNFLMIKADSYWFPSPESKYKESLAELELYKKKLLAGNASFYTRTDNIIPLFAAYEDLLGSCDENLVKFKEPDGSAVGFFKADDYFYYAKGVASAMATILEASQRDFSVTLENRRATELIHHAITYCRLAASLEPWIVTNGSLDGILANHRAHMAAPISHARYYMGQLIKTLST
jgi:hypothetical protein